jgi:hypothetical protein
MVSLRVLASAALFIMPNRFVVSGWNLDHGRLHQCVLMEPFRALLAIIFGKQRTMGFAMQSFFIDWRLLHQNYR